ncbi:S1 RNA-binding domain-containing protein [Streptomyces sp. 4R-3d]|uniref:S1 RNA-binding domain-containing protein n=1 Tax=Streptomyces sp. 4R-3d TaxID=2559605 RepID=UPI0032AF62CB
MALDDGPVHPVFPGVGFITIPELSWRRIEAVSDVVRVGQRVSCEFLQFDTWNGEARLSLRATEPDPFGGVRRRRHGGADAAGAGHQADRVRRFRRSRRRRRGVGTS